MSDTIPQFGGSVHVNGNGVAACARGDWRGVPIRQGGRLVTWCPTCEADELARDLDTPAERVGRNAPCPCGSGRKYKKCCA